MQNPPSGFFDDWLGARRRAEGGEPSRGGWLLAPGTRIGAWRVGGPLGRGGSCDVYHAEFAESLSHAEFAESAEFSGSARARRTCEPANLRTCEPGNVGTCEPANLRTGRSGALRILHRTDATAAERFRREVGILRGTDHPALPRLLDAGETPDGRPWMVVEELERRELPRRDRDVARFVLALCGGLAHLHALGVVHRDVKPSNVLFRADGSPVLIDLGLVTRSHGHTVARSSGPANLSTLSVVDGRAVGVGTPGYAAPEQFAGGEVTPASDTYALGVLADACFDHRPPRCWRALLRRATSALPAERFATAEALARAVRRRHAPAAALAAAAVAIAAVMVAGRAASRPEADPPLESLEPLEPLESLEPLERPDLSAARALAERLEAEAEPAWREVAEYSVYDGRPLVRVRLEGRHVALARPLDLAEPQTVEIVGPGRLDAAITGTPQTLVTVRDAAVIDATEDPDPAHSPRFRLGPGAFVTLPNVLSVFPGDFAEPYDEPDPENPEPGDRALRFSTAETSLGAQMALERELLAEAAARAAEDRDVPAPEIGEALGWTNAVWTTGAANPVRPDPSGDGSVVFHVEGGIGEAHATGDFESLGQFRLFLEKNYPGRADHGGRGGLFQVRDEHNRNSVLFDGRSGRPSDGWQEHPGRGDLGRFILTFRFRSDLWTPPGHEVGVRLRLVPE